jgi:hypothetical protein
MSGRILLLSLAYYSDDRPWDRGRLARSFGTRHSQGICGRDARGPRGRSLDPCAVFVTVFCDSQ